SLFEYHLSQKAFHEKLFGTDDSQRVTFNGNVPHADMADYWEKADICVLVSDFEGTSISMLEAMSHGCVPVVTDVSGTKAVIQDGVNGLIVPIGDMNRMADCVESLIDDRQKLKKMGRAAHLSVAEKYSFENYMAWFLTTRQAIWNKPPRQWPLGRTLLPEKFQPKPPPSLSERAANKAKRIIDKARLSLKIRGILGR
ncbi:MAG: glycosyltransferase family 4 protein, partial [Cyanobacteria bacterium J06626_26]